MQLHRILFVALAGALVANGNPLPQADYGGVTETPKIQGLDEVLAILQGSTEKLTQFLQGKSRRQVSTAPQDPPEINLQDTLLGVVPELIPLLDTLGLNVGNH